MGKNIRIGLGVLLLAVPFFIYTCGGGGDGGVTVSGTVPAGSAMWVVPDNTFADNVVTIFNAGTDNLYYNVHSAANSGGEIRGQLDATGAVRVATLTGLQEVPQVITPAFGAGAMVVDIVNNQVRGFIRTSGLTGTPTAAHIHNGAHGSGGDGPIVLTLTGGPDLWVVPDNTAADNVVAILNVAPDNLYFNVHTMNNPSGEIRGQLDASGAVRLATLDGAQETPAVTTSARGAGVLVVDNVTNRVGGFILSSGLTGTVAHIQNAARGAAGDNIVTLIGGPSLWVVPDGRLSPELVAIFNVAPDNLYFNVPTAANPNGAIRGQLDASGEILFATLNGAQETPAVTTAAFGGGILSVNTLTGRVGGFLTSSGVAGTAAHIHNAARGTPGPIIVPLLPAP